jgi:hypothetical protein
VYNRCRSSNSNSHGGHNSTSNSTAAVTATVTAADAAAAAATTKPCGKTRAAEKEAIVVGDSMGGG